MKRVVCIVSLLCTIIVQAQKTDLIVNENNKSSVKETQNELKKITQQLQTIKAENKYLKALIQKQNELGQNCLVDEQYTHSEIVELNAINVKRKPKKVRKHYNTLPPPL